MQSTGLVRSGRVLFFPQRFFRTTQPNPNDAGPIVLAVAIVHLVTHYLILLGGAIIVSLQQTDSRVVDLLADLGPGMYVLGPVFAVSVVISWVVVSAGLHVGIRRQNGTGSYPDTLAVVGWSAPASLLGLLVQAVGIWLALWGDPTVTTVDARLLEIGPATRVAPAIGGILTLLWQGAIWPAGLERAHDVSGAAAGKATAETVLLCALVLLAGLATP